MSTEVLKQPGSLRNTYRPAGALRLVLPKEHGSWSLALEPVALGLLVAPSLAAAATAAAATAATGLFTFGVK